MYLPARRVLRTILRLAVYFAESEHQENFWILHSGSVCRSLRQKKKLTIPLGYCIIVYQCFEDIQDTSDKIEDTKGKERIDHEIPVIFNKIRRNRD